MFGDCRQGAILLLGGYSWAFKKKIPLGKVIATVGVFSIIFGFFYGSVFGYEDIFTFGFKTMHSSENINITLIASILIGIFCTCMVIVINIINGIRQKNLEKTVFDFNGIVGLIFYVSIIAGVLLLLGSGTSVFTPLYIIIFVVLPLLIMFFKHPLAKLAARKKDWLPKNMGEYILENFFELFEVILSFATNTISYIRIGAFALNHVGMMMVVFILAKGSAGSDNLFVIIIGNAIVIALEGLIVGVQVLRLHYYEFFSRFYSGSGREFNPITLNYNNKTV
jgi:V/A-type H+-transporting ATPase subunit I